MADVWLVTVEPFDLKKNFWILFLIKICVGHFQDGPEIELHFLLPTACYFLSNVFSD